MVHLNIQGNLQADTAGILDRTVQGCVAGGQLLVVHLGDLQFASADGLGALLDARQRMLANGLSLTLSGVSARMKVLFSAWCLEPLFDEFKMEQELFAMDKKAAQSVRFASLVGNEVGATAKIEG